MSARSVSPRLRDAITEVYNTWWDKRAPERTRGERAAASAVRRRAIAGNWCAGAALDDDQLDTPGYRPAHGWKPARGTGTAPDIRMPAHARTGLSASRTGRSRSSASQRKDLAMTQHQRDSGPSPGSGPPAYVVELWVSEQLRDRTRRNGRSLAKALEAQGPQDRPGEPDFEAEP